MSNRRSSVTGEMVAGFDLVPLQLDYTIGGGQEGGGKKFGELIIKSWDNSQAGLLWQHQRSGRLRAGAVRP
ncbi:hypothetical protein [Stenotrophomonas sp. 59]|uniref:hypothetical protein n=1 Tax=Stenotrophomonas sp. 59 TaxID=3051120 RepID=UPI00256F18BE|nr:hypothetical protein [Stenotrophomonas sp. 59]